MLYSKSLCSRFTLFSLIILCSLFGCSKANNSTPDKPEQVELTESTGSEAKKQLRVLTWSGYETYLPRSGSPLTLELDYLEQFAEGLDYELHIIQVSRFSELIPKLLANEGDLISANLTVNDKRKALVKFTVPCEETTEFLVQAKQSQPITYASQLDGISIGLQRGTSFEETARGLQKTYKDISLVQLPSSMGTEAIYDQLVEGKFDAIIEDKNTLSSSLQYRKDIQQSLQASSKRKIAWALNPNNTELLKELNHFLRQNRLTIHNVQSYKNRWHRIQQEKTIRVALKNNFASYYIWRGELLGFNYELAKKFAKDNRLRLEVVVAPDHEDLINYLIEDKADISIAYLTPTKERIEQGIAFSTPYHYATEMVVTRQGDESINKLEDLAHRSVATRKSSSYWQTASDLQTQMPMLEMVEVNDALETESIIGGVARKEFDTTIADSHLINLELTFRDDIHAPLAVSEPKGQSWAVPETEPELLKAVNTFIKRNYRGLFYNVKYQQYFENSRRITQHHKHYDRIHQDGTLSPYDQLVQKYAKQYGFDWRLMVAQMHQESKFSNDAVSFAGATGLFQVMPRTAEQLGVDDLNDPETNIRAGIEYMDWVRERMTYLDPDEDELIWFTLAAYNAGAGHVRDAAYLADKKGWDPQLWFGHVEKAMLLLSKSKYYKKARHGYVRGIEPVTYVREIKRRYDTFSLAVQETTESSVSK